MSSTGTKTTSRTCSRRFGAADPDTRAWGFWPESTLGLWERRRVIETGVHRWDAEQAFGDPGALTDLVALSGLNEFETMWLPRLGELPVLEVKAVDLGGPGCSPRDRHYEP